MKKIFKALAITAASAAMCVGVAAASGCTGGNGKYVGEYHYTNQYGATYGMMVEVTVENNIITKVRDITNTNLDAQDGKTWTTVSSAMPDWGWTEAAVNNWTENESYLLQKYEGWSVADILDVQVFIKETGEPYSKDKNTEFSDLIISGSTQGSGRLMLAVQNALGKTTDIGRIGAEKAE